MKRWQKTLLVVLGVVVVALVALSFVLDSIITSKAREQTDKLSQEWGRPVTLGGVATKFLTGLGVRISDVAIGAGPGESAPLVTIHRIEVKMALLDALFSGGKKVEVRSAEIEGLSVNLIKLPGGETNLERLQKKLAENAEPKKEEEAKKPPADLSFLRIDHVGLTEGAVAFIDESGAKGSPEKQLGVKHLDVTINDLRAGQPLEIVLKAAVLNDKQNLELRVKAAPLPNTLTPTPTTIALHVDPPIDLAPLGPFAGSQVGLDKGTFDADFDAELGAAVPGGAGPTKLKGAVKLAGLHFAGAEGGKALDVVLDTDVQGDAAKGDVQIDKLRLDIGPAGITGHGRASGLVGGTPKIEGLEIIGHDLDPARIAAYYPPLKKQLNGMLTGPIGLDVHASGTQAQQALELKLDFAKVSLNVPEVLTKAAGAAMSLTAHARGAAATGGALHFDVALELSGIDLRPGQSVDKAPGQRLDVRLDGAKSGEKIQIIDLKAHILDDELEGQGSFETKGKAKQFELALQSSHLDLDKMLIPSKAKPKEKKPVDPAVFAGLSGHATVKIDKLRMQKQEMTDIVADVSMAEDAVKVNKADLKAFGGTVSAAGTELKLAHPREPFHVVTKINNVEAQNLLAMATEHKILSGKFNGSIDLKGGGQELAELSKTLAGALDGHILDGSFFGKDLMASVSGPLAKALPFGLAGKTGEGGQTSLGKDLPFGVTLENGVAHLKQPLKVARPEGEFSLGGGMKVDGTLDLAGVISLSPQTVSSITGGKAKPQQAVPFNVKITGPAWSPTVSDFDLKPAVSQLAKEAGSALLGKALGVDNVDQAVDQKKKEAEDAAKKKQEELQKQAQDQADAARKKVEDEAKNKLKGLFGR